MTRAKRVVRTHPIRLGLAVLVLAATGCAAWLWKTTMDVPTSVVYFGVPDAPKLTASTPDQTVYRIDPSRSSVTYSVEEKLAGSSHTATGSTKGVAGDILVDDADPAASRMGQVVVNVQQLTSDQRLRDERIRHDFLESNTHRLARFQATDVTGMPDEIVDGTAYDVQVAGDLTVKETTAPVTLDATVTRTGDELAIEATTTVQLSAFDVGPINLIGLVKTGDDATLTFDLVAVDAEVLGDPTQFAAAPAAEEVSTSGGPAFSTAVLPVLEAGCASCHNTGGAGAQIWTLDDAGDAARVAKGLGLVVESGYMPPWPASDESVPFQHSKELAPEDAEAVVAWAKAGGQLDVDPDTPVKAPPNAAPQPRPDAVLRADTPYQGSTDLPNDYRCLVMDPKLTEPTTVTAYGFVPDQTEYVHHALVFRMSAETRDAVQARDDGDPGAGYRCFGGVGVGRGQSASGGGGGAELVTGWAPGQDPVMLPDDVGLRLDVGDYFVVQVHYHFMHAAPPDRSELVLQTEPDGTRPQDLKITTYLAPAEIPCGPDQSGPMCDRDAVIEELRETYGSSLAADGLHLLCGTTVEELGVLDENGIARSSCDHRIRTTGQIFSVLGHEHEIGSSFRMTLNPDTPDERILLDIPQWDFDWQMNYRPQEAIVLEPGDVVRIECSWDRSLVHPDFANRWITWAEGTEDEMCYSTIATLQPADE